MPHERSAAPRRAVDQLQDSVGGTVTTDGSGHTQPVSGAVSVSNFPATQPVSGTVTANQGTAGATKWLTDGSGVTQPISADSLPLPDGAATDDTLARINGAVQDAALTAILERDTLAV